MLEKHSRIQRWGKAMKRILSQLHHSVNSVLFFSFAIKNRFVQHCFWVIAIFYFFSFSGNAEEYLVSHGSFELGTYFTEKYIAVDAGDDDIKGWNVAQGNVDYITTAWQPSSGSKSIDLNGTGPGAIEQSFTTTPGVRYKVQVDVAGNPGGGDTWKLLEISADNQTITIGFSISGKSRSDMGWETHYWFFTADDSSATLKFKSLSPSPFGPAIDNVVVEEAQIEPMITAGRDHTVGLKTDGTAVGAGSSLNGQSSVYQWSDIRQVAATRFHTVGLKTDGTAVEAGGWHTGSLNTGIGVSSLGDIQQVAVGMRHAVGLRWDNTVVAVGANGDGQCNVDSWSDIRQVAAKGDTTVGLKTDGTVVIAGDDGYVQYDVSAWNDIQQVAVGFFHIVGLKSDGSVVAVGDNSLGQCNVSSWSDIRQVIAGAAYTVGLKSDGTVVAVGDNSSGQCNVSSWNNIRQVAAGEIHTVGLTSDGSVLAVGSNVSGQCNVSSWNLFIPSSTWYRDWDGDGYGDPDVWSFGTTPPDYADHAANNTDCDDSDNAIYPGAAEIEGDNIDQDCDGSDLNASPAYDQIFILTPLDNDTVGYDSSGGKVLFSFSKITNASKYILRLQLYDIFTDSTVPVPIELIPPGTGGGSAGTPGFSDIAAIGMVFELTLDSVTWDALALYKVQWGVEAYDDAGVTIGSTYLGATASQYVNRLKFTAGNAITMVSPSNGASLDKAGDAPKFQWDAYQGASTYRLILAHAGVLGFDSVIVQDNLPLNFFSMDDPGWETMVDGTWYWTVLGYDSSGSMTPVDFTIFNFEVQ